MAYRKILPKALYTGSSYAAPGTVLVTDFRGSVIDLVPLAEAGEGIEKTDGVLAPGFINSHCHLELSHMLGMIPEGVGMVPFLLSVLDKRNAPQEEIRQAALDAEQAMWRSGIVAVGDISNTPDTLPIKETGRLYYHSFVEALGFSDTVAPQRFAESMDVVRRFEEAAQKGGGKVSLVPHASYSVSPALFRLIAEQSGDSLVSMHNQESTDEEMFFLNGGGAFPDLFRYLNISAEGFGNTGQSSLHSVLPHLKPFRKLLLVHNVQTSAADLAAAQEGRQVYWCFCPRANRYITGALPDLNMFRAMGASILIGTDSPASNHSLDMIEELKCLQQAYPDLSAAEMLGWITGGAAEAFGIADRFGFLSPGFRPGIVLIEGLEDDRLLPEAKSRRLI